MIAKKAIEERRKQDKEALKRIQLRSNFSEGKGADSAGYVRFKRGYKTGNLPKLYRSYDNTR